MLLVDNFAHSLKLEVGGKAKLIGPGGFRELTVAGLVEPSGIAGFNGGAVLFVTLPAARKMFKLGDQVTAIPIEVADNGDAERVRAEVAAQLPAGLEVRSPATRGELARHSLFGAEQGLSTLSAVSIVAGAFVILNSFLMSLGERRRQLAILRAIGVTRKQVTRLLVREAVILGIVGMVLGVLVGLVASMLLARTMEQLLGITLRDMELTAQPFVLAAIFGPGMAVLAAFAPARRAAQRPPLADLLGLQLQAGDGMARRMRRTGTWLGIGSVTMIVLLVTGSLPVWLRVNISAPLMGLFLVSGILLSPAALPPISRFVARVMGSAWGIEGRLALAQLEKNPVRSSLTAAVLCVAMIISISMGQSIRNNIHDVEEWSQRTFTADYLVRGTLPELSYALGAQLPEALHAELMALPDVAAVHELNLIQAKTAGEAIVVMARSFDDEATATLDIAEGERSKVVSGLLAGEAVIGTALAQRLELGIGDSLMLRTRRGEHAIPIAGKVTEYVAGGMAVYLERKAAKELFAFDGVDVYMVTAKPGRIGELGEAMQAFCGPRGLMLQSNAEFRARIHHMMAGVIGFLWMLMALVFVVASLGIVNTLTMNVMEQTREIAVLRSVALLRGQVRTMVLYQALTLALSSLLPGVGMGLLLAFLMNLSTHVLLGQMVEFQADWWFVLICAAGGLAIACGASWIPGRRASRLQIVRALQYQ